MVRRYLIAAGVAALAAFASYIVIYGPVSVYSTAFPTVLTTWYNYYLVLSPPVSVAYNLTAYNITMKGVGVTYVTNYYPRLTVYYYPPTGCGPAGVYQVAGQCFNETPILLVNETCRPPPTGGSTTCVLSAVLNESGLYRVGVDYLCTGYC